MAAETPTCIFCAVVAKSTPADIVYESEDTLFFRDINPKARVHVLGVPKTHIASLGAINTEHYLLLGKLLHDTVHVAESLGIRDSGYRVLTNHGPDSGQEVQHLHWHILGGEPLGPVRS